MMDGDDYAQALQGVTSHTLALIEGNMFLCTDDEPIPAVLRYQSTTLCMRMHTLLTEVCCNSCCLRCFVLTGFR